MHSQLSFDFRFFEIFMVKCKRKHKCKKLSKYSMLFKKIGGVNHEKEFYDFLNSNC